MKIKQVCEMTGLTPRAVRLYCERGLIKPCQQMTGGRVYTEFSRQDVDTLWRIGVLRRMEFTLEEIGRMIASRESLNTILDQHMITLEAKGRKIQRLLAVITQVQQEPQLDLAHLADALEEAFNAHEKNQPPSRPGK
ncbi:MAG: MerR family transcriptional regulator [Clostridia bacterium]|nr:MerR family transcriptional regulator [Clostridia bacterium]